MISMAEPAAQVDHLKNVQGVKEVIVVGISVARETVRSGRPGNLRPQQ
jgi:hypothetical protein